MERRLSGCPVGDPSSRGCFRGGYLGAHLDGIDIDAATVLVETHFAFDEGVNRVITTNTDVLAGVPLGAALAEDDVAGNNFLAAKFFHSAALALAIATVLDATLSFFMGHDSLGKTFKNADSLRPRRSRVG